jgi:hypothetical protein
MCICVCMLAVWHVSVCIVCISACICMYWFTCTSIAEKLMGVSWSVSVPLSRPFSTTVPERAGFGGPAQHKLGPSSCTCPLRSRLCILFRSPTSSAVYPDFGTIPRSMLHSKDTCFPRGKCDREGQQGSGSPLYYINLWAMIWPTDYPAATHWINKQNLLQTCVKAWIISVTVCLHQHPTHWLIDNRCMQIQADGHIGCIRICMDTYWYMNF